MDGFSVLTIKETFNLYPHADVVYGCDAAWWKYRKGLPEFHGLKLAWAGARLDEYPDIRRVKIDADRNNLTFDRVGQVGGGGNSGFQSLNLAAQFGARRIALVGFDMRVDDPKLHWYGRNGWQSANNPNYTSMARWIMALKTAARQLAGRGVEVVNVSPNSAVEGFRRVTLADVAREWTSQSS